MTGDSIVQLSLLNHASVLICAEDVKIVTDPWYFGHAFDEGWGLRYINDQALAKAATATHLWISHFHEDHFHTPTLKKLLEVNPEIVFLANKSHNFDLAARARSLGFKNVVTFNERQPLKLNKNITAARYPATGIDNMLLLKGPNWTILNFNDCVIPPLSRRLLARKFGAIDIFMCNFNHAGKLLHKNKMDDSRVKEALLHNFRHNSRPFHPKIVLPFASHHYYRAPESALQNSSMLKVGELASVDSKVIALDVGKRLEYAPDTGDTRIVSECDAHAEEFTQIRRPESVPFETLTAAAQQHMKKIKSGFSFAAHLLPPLTIGLYDLKKALVLGSRRGLAAAENYENSDIECHSSAALKWLTKPYGTDAFAVGAHFRIASARKSRLVMHLAAGMLVENKLDMKSLLSMLGSRSGLSFLVHRREEIAGILLSGKVVADYHKE